MQSTGRIAAPLNRVLPLTLVLALVVGAPQTLLADDGNGGDDGQTTSYPDRNRNGKKDWHESGFHGKTPCEQATIIRDVGSTGAMVSGVTGFGPGMIIFGGIGLWGQMMVWSSC